MGTEAIWVPILFGAIIKHDQDRIHREQKKADNQQYNQRIAEAKAATAKKQKALHAQGEGGAAAPAHYTMGREPEQQGTTLLSGNRRPTELPSKKPKATT